MRTRTCTSKRGSNAAARPRPSSASTWKAESTSLRGCSVGKRSPTRFAPRLVRCLQDESASRKAKPSRKAKAKARKRKVVVARKYLIETFGCQMNVHESGRMARLLEQPGLE